MDESTPTCNKRFATLGIPQTEQTRRAYREWIVTTPGLTECISGVILLYGSSYWNEIVNFDALVHHGMIAREDLGLFQFVDDPATALRVLQKALALELDVKTPASARSATPRTQPG